MTGFRLGVSHAVCRKQRHLIRVSPVDQEVVLFLLICQMMPLDFHIELMPEGFFKNVEPCLGEFLASAITKRAIEWAGIAAGKRDHTLRPHFATEAALAWALHVDGRRERAVALADRVLASGASDPPLVARMTAVQAGRGITPMGGNGGR